MRSRDRSDLGVDTAEPLSDSSLRPRLAAGAFGRRDADLGPDRSPERRDDRTVLMLVASSISKYWLADRATNDHCRSRFRSLWQYPAGDISIVPRCQRGAEGGDIVGLDPVAAISRGCA